MSAEARTTTAVSATSRPAAASSPVLRADNIARFFVDGDRRLDVLKGVDMALHAGEVAALIGRSGCGKSTLLHLIGLLDKPDSGEILIDGTPAGNLSERERAYIRNTRIGFIFQHYFLLPEFTVLENVEMPAKIAHTATEWLSKRDTYRKRALALLESVGLSTHLQSRPKTLSGGERQRVAVARALILEPHILLCDEPTGNLDPETGSHIMELIFTLSRKQGTAVLVVTHDRAFSARADRTYLLEQGGLVSAKE
jgi:lipoprotein-releasing system ATP-binding protein